MPMTLVLETAPGISPESDAAISAVLSQYNLRCHEPSLRFGAHTIYYFQVPGGEDASAAAAALAALPGVTGAYVKPEGMPPIQ